MLQTTSELKIAKLCWMILCVHAKLCSKKIFRAIYPYVGYSVFLCYSLEMSDSINYKIVSFEFE